MIIRSKTPLRLGLAGGGTDVSPYSDLYGGRILNATIDLYAYCTLEIWDKPQIVFDAVDRDEHFESSPAPELEPTDYMILHKGVYNRIVREFNNDEPLCFRMTTYSDALAGSGLGSSSTMVVAMITAFVEWLKLPLGEYDIAQLAYEIERKDLGLSGGKQDQYAAAFGGFNFMEFYADDRVIVNPLRVKDWIIAELESSLILYFTGVSRDSDRIIDEQKRNVEDKNQRSVEAMHQLKQDAIEMKEAILRGSINAFADCLGRSWESKKQMAGAITNPEIDKMYQSALEAGTYAGKLTGAGGGGFMMLFAEPSKKVNVIRQLNALPGRVYNFHFTGQGTISWCIHD